MGSLGPTLLIFLLLAVAIIAAIGGFIASAVARRNKRRLRGFFLFGFFCGFLTGAIAGRRRRGRTPLGLWPARWRRRVSQRLPLGRGPSAGATRAGVLNALTQAGAALSLVARP